MLITCVAIQKFWKKLVKPLKNYGPLPIWKNNIFGRNNKRRSSAFTKFLFYQNICFDWVMNLFLSWVMLFCQKSVISSVKTAMYRMLHNCPWLFKSFEFGNGSRMSVKNLVILEFKYLQNKKWWKQAIKSARIKKSYRTYWLFSFYSDNW